MSITTIDGIDYGPLAALVGNWKGDKGTDIAPEPDGTENSPYHETILFEAIGDVTNAEEQTLAVLRYHQIVRRQKDDAVFHNETGYLSWDPAVGMVYKSFTIPRAVGIVAGGKVGADGEIVVEATLGDPDFGIVQQPFMREKASTKAYRYQASVVDDELRYEQTMVLDIYGREFDHTDTNCLTKV